MPFCYLFSLCPMSLIPLSYVKEESKLSAGSENGKGGMGGLRERRNEVAFWENGKVNILEKIRFLSLLRTT